MAGAGSGGGGCRRGPSEADPCHQDVSAGSLLGGGGAAQGRQGSDTGKETQPEQGVLLGFF